MAAPTFVAASAGAGSATAPAIGVPSGVQADDILIVVISTANESIATPTNTGGAGGWSTATWVEIGDQTLSGSGAGKQCNGTAAAVGAIRLAVYWMRFTSGMTIGTTTIADSGNHTTGQMYAFRGCIATGNPYSYFKVGTGTGVAIYNFSDGLSCTTNDTGVLIAAHSIDSSSAQLANWSGFGVSGNFPEGGDVSTNAGVGGGVGLGYASPIVTTTISAFVDAANGTGSLNWAGMRLALIPPLPIVLPDLITEPMTPSRYR